MDEDMDLSKRLDLMQRQVVDQMVDHFKDNKSGYLSLPTGTGKTRTACKYLDERFKSGKKGKVLWLTSGIELIEQSRIALKRYFPLKSVGLIQYPNYNYNSEITIASVESLNRDHILKRVDSNHFSFIVVDECHHVAAKTWKKIIEYFDCSTLGLTPTPYRLDGKDLNELLGTCIAEISYSDAVKEKYIAKEDYRLILTNSIMEGIEINSVKFKKASTDKLVISRDRNNIIVDSYKKYGRAMMDAQGVKYKTLCFCVNIRHAITMEKVFTSKGVSAKVFHARTASRDEVYEEFKSSSTIEVLCVVNIMNEGKNIPDITCVLLCRPTRSLGLFVNQLGRATRYINGYKSRYCVLDYVDLVTGSYMPIRISNYSDTRYSNANVIREYYTGKDPIVVNEQIENLSKTIDSLCLPFKKWSREEMKAQILNFFMINGSISTNDITMRNGLPSRGMIEKEFGCVGALFEELNINLDRSYNIEDIGKEEIKDKLIEFYKKNGKIVVTDLGSKNNLPSQKRVYKHWGTFTNFCKDAGIKSISRKKWTKERVIEAVIKFNASNEAKLKKRIFDSNSELPSYCVVRRLFGNLELLNEVVN